MNFLKKQKLIFNKKLRKKRNEKIIGEKDFQVKDKILETKLSDCVGNVIRKEHKLMYKVF